MVAPTSNPSTWEADTKMDTWSQHQPGHKTKTGHTDMWKGGKIGRQWEQSEYVTYIYKITKVYILLLKRKMNQVNQTDNKNPEPKMPMVGISPLI